jgi:diketogulonate reductase-like aldo/keto reductase
LELETLDAFEGARVTDLEVATVCQQECIALMAWTSIGKQRNKATTVTQLHHNHNQATSNNYHMAQPLQPKQPQPHPTQAHQQQHYYHHHKFDFDAYVYAVYS